MPPNVHNIKDYKMALKIAEDFPKIIQLFDKLKLPLYKYNRYTSVAKVLQLVEEEQVLLKLHLDKYKKIKDNKGKNDV